MIARFAVAFGLRNAFCQAAAAQDTRLIERGAYLLGSIATCGNCHA